MKNIRTLFDYIFYRVFSFFRDKGDNSPETKGVLILSMIQFLTFLDVVVFIRIIYPFSLPDTLFIIPLVVLPAVVNWFRYERDFDIKSFDDKWENEGQKEKNRKGWWICLHLLASFLIPAVHGYMEHNLRII
jgi:uncharacterized membrane-anchored protein